MCVMSVPQWAAVTAHSAATSVAPHPPGLLPRNTTGTSHGNLHPISVNQPLSSEVPGGTHYLPLGTAVPPTTLVPSPPQVQLVLTTGQHGWVTVGKVGVMSKPNLFGTENTSAN